MMIFSRENLPKTLQLKNSNQEFLEWSIVGSGERADNVALTGGHSYLLSSESLSVLSIFPILLVFTMEKPVESSCYWLYGLEI